MEIEFMENQLEQLAYYLGQIEGDENTQITLSPQIALFASRIILIGLDQWLHDLKLREEFLPS